MRWTEEEYKIFKQHYGKISCKEIYDHGLLPGRSVSSLYNKADELDLEGGFRRITHSFDQNFWKEPNPLNAYWAGVISADGCIVENRPNAFVLQLQVAIKDIDHLQRFQDAIKFTGKIRFYKKTCSLVENDTVSEMCYISVSRAALWANDLKNKWGIIPKKTFHIVPPNIEDIILKFCFLRGYLDGDGTITADYNKGYPLIRFTSCSETIVRWFETLFNEYFPDSLNGKGSSKPTNDYGNGNCYYYSVCGFRALKVVEILSRLPVPVMTRKWENPRILEIMESYKKRYPEQWARRLPIEDEIDAFLAFQPVPAGDGQIGGSAPISP